MSDDSEPALRVLSILTPRDDMDAAACADHWRTVHAGLVTELPHLLAYRQYDVLGEIARPARTLAGPPVFGIAELLFDSVAGRLTDYASPVGARLTADGANFVGGGRSFRVQRRPILDRTSERPAP